MGISRQAPARAPQQGAFLASLAGKAHVPPPIWLMRQAGRYLPEYRETRARAGSFLDLCYNPELAAEVTLQPIRRFGFDAAILFSDILVVPHALGQKLWFEEGEGPRLEPVADAAALARLSVDAAVPRFDLVAETVSRVRAGLPSSTALIGFCGAPWTVATYMVAGRGSQDQAAARLWAYRDPAGFAALVDLVVEASIDYLARQVAAGADCLQIFDSWSGSLAEPEFERWVIEPTKAILAGLKARGIAVPVIGFPRGAGLLAARYVRATGVAGLGCDTAMPLDVMARDLSPLATLQGNLDPLLLVSGGEALDRRIDQILAAMAGRPFIFNLGHGIVPETPPDHVARLVALVRRTSGA
ncbi:MAG: uroporphyrinogen decarboxylase [Hyphomicrobiaceae bacterium]